MPVAVVVPACVFTLALVVGAMLVLVLNAGQRPDPGDEQADTDTNGEGGDPRRRPPPPPKPTGGDPEWWPAFERQFADHVARRRDLVVR